ncbi:TPA: hypothetical protein ACH3X2_004045 [Trebouxia sp. C0005]
MPKAMQMDILIDDLEPELRMQVVATIPKTAEQAIQNAVHLQECLTGAVADKLRLYEGQYKKTGSDTIEQLASSLGRMIVALHNNSSKQGFMLRQAYDDDATDSDVPARLTDYVCEPFLESNACFLANQCFSEDYVPSTPEAEMYVVQMPTRPFRNPSFSKAATAKSLGGDKRKSDVASRSSGEESEALDKKKSKFNELSGNAVSAIQHAFKAFVEEVESSFLAAFNDHFGRDSRNKDQGRLLNRQKRRLTDDFSRQKCKGVPAGEVLKAASEYLAETLLYSYGLGSQGESTKLTVQNAAKAIIKAANKQSGEDNVQLDDLIEQLNSKRPTFMA